ncbi:MAG TPA: UDP-2,3-diacylglucosamine diphosphatase LpxI [Elusimicrobiota bacterium]|nr:UDP-2,3-diacylglucosamine diphosphatase LpxI [Elusimicrobiota bacterium]
MGASAPSPAKTKIGLIAGNGAFPLLFAREARRRGETVIAVALKEEADARIESVVDGVAWLSLGQLGRTISYFKEQGVGRAVMAGQVKHTQLFRDIVPDLRVVKLLARVANKKAASLLSAVIQEFEEEGIQFLSSAMYLENWLCPEGLLTSMKLNSAEAGDIEFALPLARLLAAQDVGQTLAAKDKTVVAVEAMEGTDACIRRAGTVAGPGCVVLKVARPKQDLRFDIPVVGPGTLAALRDAKARVLAMEAGKTLLLDKDELIREANASEITLTGLRI